MMTGMETYYILIGSNQIGLPFHWRATGDSAHLDGKVIRLFYPPPWSVHAVPVLAIILSSGGMAGETGLWELWTWSR